MTYHWANDDHIGIVRIGGAVTVYLESGPEYQAAVAGGPLAPLQSREWMTCTPMQGQLALGETNWGIILAWRDANATWAQKVIINSAQTWVRNSQNIAFFQYLLGFTDEQVDELFRVAKEIDA